MDDLLERKSHLVQETNYELSSASRFVPETPMYSTPQRQNSVMEGILHPESACDARPVQNRSQISGRQRQECTTYSLPLPHGLIYDGESEINTFMDMFFCYAKSQPWYDSDEAVVYKLYLCLRGKASDYFSMLVKDNRNISSRDIVEKLYTRFRRVNYPNKAQVDFHNAKQLRWESLDDWYDRLLSLSVGAFEGMQKEHVDENIKMKIVSGLHDRVAARYVANKRLQSLDEVVDAIRWYKHIEKTVPDVHSNSWREVDTVRDDGTAWRLVSEREERRARERELADEEEWEKRRGEEWRERERQEEERQKEENCRYERLEQERWDEERKEFERQEKEKREEEERLVSDRLERERLEEARRTWYEDTEKGEREERRERQLKRRREKRRRYFRNRRERKEKLVADETERVVPILKKDETQRVVPVLKKTGVGACPYPGCGHLSRKLKKHVLFTHLPSCFREVAPSGLSSLILFQRTRFVRAVARKIPGVRGHLHKLCEQITRFSLIPETSVITDRTRAGMVAASHYNGWKLPEGGFTICPINGVGALMHWRVLCAAVSLLSSRDRVSLEGFLL